ncbi:MAG: hypothetical protein HGA47_00580 [Zoogloea sp.]|nr:hypothetical protein [Zoogloea sp.]
MNIRQLQISFDAVQDRLLLRVSTAAKEEYSAWLTRRLVRQLWPHLVRILSEHLQGAGKPQEAPAKDAQPGQTFDEPYRADDLNRPLGTTPVLAGEASFDLKEAGLCQLILREPRERSFGISLDRDMMEAFCSMLRAAVAPADWNLVLDYANTTPAATPSSTPSRSSILH